MLSQAGRAGSGGVLNQPPSHTPQAGHRPIRGRGTVPGGMVPLISMHWCCWVGWASLEFLSNTNADAFSSRNCRCKRSASISPSMAPTLGPSGMAWDPCHASAVTQRVPLQSPQSISPPAMLKGSLPQLEHFILLPTSLHPWGKTTSLGDPIKAPWTPKTLPEPLKAQSQIQVCEPRTNPLFIVQISSHSTKHVAALASW